MTFFIYLSSVIFMDKSPILTSQGKDDKIPRVVIVINSVVTFKKSNNVCHDLNDIL